MSHKLCLFSWYCPWNKWSKNKTDLLAERKNQSNEEYFEYYHFQPTKLQDKILHNDYVTEELDLISWDEILKDPNVIAHRFPAEYRPTEWLLYEDFIQLSTDYLIIFDYSSNSKYSNSTATLNLILKIVTWSTRRDESVQS